MVKGYKNYYEQLRKRIDKEEQERKEKRHINHRCYLCGKEESNFFHHENGNIIIKCIDCVRKENYKRLKDMRRRCRICQ